MSNSDKYCNGSYQNAVSKMVDREVHACASYLVTHLMEQEQYNSSEYNQELMDVCVQYTDNSEEIEKCEERIEGLESERDETSEEFYDLQQTINNSFSEYPHGDLWTDWLLEWCDYQIDHIEKIYNELIEIGEQIKADLESDQDEPNEAYEHWIVSDWLGSQLKDAEEMVEDIAGLTIWGRCTTGQSIMLDYVICNIFDQTYEGREWAEDQNPKPEPEINKVPDHPVQFSDCK